MAEILPACYHFIYPLPANPSQPLRDPIKQANYHWNAAGGEIAFIDCEWPAPQDFVKWGVTGATINQWMITYFQEYTRLDGGRKPGLYTYPYFAAAIKFDASFVQYPLWIASYEPAPVIPAPFTNYKIWQNTGGTQKLYNGTPCDTNIALDLSLWDTPEVAPPPDPPPPPPIPDPPPQDPVVVPVAPAPVAPPVSSNIFSSIVSAISNFFK